MSVLPALKKNAPNSFYISGFYKLFLALHSSEIRLSFLVKMGAFKAG